MKSFSQTFDFEGRFFGVKVIIKENRRNHKMLARSFTQLEPRITRVVNGYNHKTDYSILIFAPYSAIGIDSAIKK